MPLEVLLDLIRKHYSPMEGQALVSSLQQDPLVWQFVQNEEISLRYFHETKPDLKSFKPGNIITWLINTTLEESVENLNKFEIPLPEDLKSRSSQAYDTVINTGLPPTDLLTAGLIALSLREKRIKRGNWKGISSETFVSSRQQDTTKLFQIWRTPFACLFSLCPDFDDFIVDFLHSDNQKVVLASIPAIIHTFLSNTLTEQETLDHIHGLLVNRSIDLQLEGLKWLETFKRIDLRRSLAKNLLETRKNIDYFASVFSDLEAFRTAKPDLDPLENEIRYSLPEDLNRLGAFYYYSGDEQKSAEAYQNASDLLKFLESQTLFQSIKSQKGQVSPSLWMGLMSSVPNSRTAKYYYIQSLIDMGQYEEAQDKLNSLADSSEKQVLALQIEQKTGQKALSDIKSLKEVPEKNNQKSTSTAPYYVHQASFGEIEKLVEVINAQNDIQQAMKFVDLVLQNNYHDLDLVKQIRNIYETNQNYDKALDLTAYLERREPDQYHHKSVLARLYSKKNRWEETYTILQEFIKSTHSPQIEDLERFAESALKTGREDTAISVCQNILKKEAQNTKALILLGESFMGKGDIIKAIQHMEQVVEMIPEEPDTWLTLAHLWEENGQADRAFEILSEGVVALPAEPKLLHRLGKVYLKRGSPFEALSYLQKANDIDPENLDVRLDFAKAYYQLNQYDAAWSLLEPFKADYQQYPEMSRLLGHLLLSMDDKDTAEPILLFAANHFPEDTSTVLKAARLVLEKHETSFDKLPEEELDHIKEILKKASNLNPGQSSLKLHLVDVERLTGKYQQALESYRELSTEMNSQKTSENWRLDYGLGKTAIALGEYEMGLAALQDAGSKQPENLLILHGLVEGYQKANLTSKANDLAQASLKLAPQELQNILWYANYKNNNNEPEEAIKALKDALQINQFQPKIKLQLAKIFISTGSYEEAKSQLTDLITDSNIQPEELHQVAYACVRMNEFKLAISALEEAIEKENSFKPIYLLDLASAYLLIEQPKKAFELLNIDQESLRKFPQISLLKSDILSNLGQYQLAYNTLANFEENAADALNKESEIIDENLSPLLYTKDFTFSGYLYRLGQLNRVLGNLDLAKSNLTEAVNQCPDDDEILCAKFDSFIQTFDREGIEKEFKLGSETEFEKGALNVDYLDIICSQAEWLITQGSPENAETIINKLSPANRTYPRYLAIQSRLSAIKGDFTTAENYYNEANEVYQSTLADLKSKDLQILFRKLRNLVSLAEAAREQEKELYAVQIHEKAWRILDNQPFNNWLFAESLIQAAENQQKARALSIRNHSPGESILSEDYRKVSQLLLENLKQYLPNDTFICYDARISAAFSGEWPLNLNSDVCLGSPEKAVSVILFTNDDSLVNNIIETYPNHPEVLQAYGIYALKNNKPYAEKYVAKALEFDTSNPINHALLAMLQNDQPEQALRSIQTALEFWPEEPEWHAFAADLYMKIDKNEMASKHISLALENQPDNADFWQRSAEINLQTNNLVYAKQDLERSASLNSNNINTWVKMADVNRRLGYVHEATENIHNASKLKPDDKSIAIKEVQFLFDTNQFGKAEETAEDLVKKESNYSDAYIMLARAQAKQGKFDQAFETLNKGSRHSPENHAINLEILKIQKDQVGAESVLPDLVKLVHEKPNDPAVLTTLTDWLIQTNRLKKAEETAQTILKILPGQAQVHLMLGRLQRKNGQLDQALAHFSDAITINPNLIDAYIEMGKTYQDRRDLEKAIEIYRKGSEADASDPRPYYYAGMAMKECKDYTGAEAMLKQAKKYAPSDPNIVRQLGMVTALNLINNLREAN
jgi:tetratricopeptide (TPR) repeat protein